MLRILFLSICFLLSLSATTASNNINNDNDIIENMGQNLKNHIPFLDFKNQSISKRINFFYTKIKPLTIYKDDIDPNTTDYKEESTLTFIDNSFDVIDKYDASCLGLWIASLIDPSEFINKKESIYKGIQKVSYEFKKYEEIEKESSLCGRLLLEILEYCTHKIQTKLINKNDNLNLIIPTQHFQDIIDLQNITEQKINDIENTLKENEKLNKEATQQEKTINDLKENIPLLEENLQNIDNYDDVKKSLIGLKELVKKTDDLIEFLSKNNNHNK